MHPRLIPKHMPTSIWAAIAALAFVAGCNGGGDDAPGCLSMLPRDCAPDPEPPTFPAIYADILRSCGSPGTGTSCHGSGNTNGLDLSTIDIAYDELLGHADDGRARVLEEDPECSVLVQRLESSDPEFRMPRGIIKLNDRQLCAVRQWIVEGAKRDED